VKEPEDQARGGRADFWLKEAAKEELLTEARHRCPQKELAERRLAHEGEDGALEKFVHRSGEGVPPTGKKKEAEVERGEDQGQPKRRQHQARARLIGTRGEAVTAAQDRPEDSQNPETELGQKKRAEGGHGQ
jgi:hypothetical protein